MKYRRRAMFISEMVALLPIIAAIGYEGTAVTVRIMRFERAASIQMSDEAKVADLIRRVERDAAISDSARIDQTDNGMTLHLTTVQYAIGDHRITRTESVPNHRPIVYDWTLERSSVRFTLESLANRPRFVWVTASAAIVSDIGPPVEHFFSTAARLQSRGAS